MHLIKPHNNAPCVVSDTVLHRLKNGKMTAAIKVVNAHFFHFFTVFLSIGSMTILVLQGKRCTKRKNRNGEKE